MVWRFSQTRTFVLRTHLADTHSSPSGIFVLHLKFDPEPSRSAFQFFNLFVLISFFTDFSVLSMKMMQINFSIFHCMACLSKTSEQQHREWKPTTLDVESLKVL
jgi:hypothetical protein